MPPPMPNPTKRMTANPARPIGRYRPGKAVQEENSSDEEYEEEEVKPQKQAQPQSRAQVSRSSAAKPRPDEHDEDDDVDEEGFVTDDDDAVPETLPTKPSASRNEIIVTAESTIASVNTNTASTRDNKLEEATNDEEDDDEDSEESEESEDYSSEEEARQRKFQRPTFIKKSDRQAKPSTTAEESNPLSAASTLEADEQLRRKAQADLLIKDKLETDLLARAAGKKAWDDDDEADPESLVDDTDNLDPEAEYEAWVLRELRRVKRDKEALEASEAEIAEKERRRNLTAAEREAEDQAFLGQQKAERDGSRSAATYMARYHHKGAFFQDDEAAEILKNRDVMGARFQDEVADKSTLPEYMRVRDMTKLGKKGRTRYTDLKGQDTGRFGEDVKRWRGAGDDGGRFSGAGGGIGGGDTRGVDERFLPDRDDRSRGPTGANASAVGTRQGASSGRRRSPRGRRDEDSYHRPRRRSYTPSDSRSRSRSPVGERRKRGHSPDDARGKRMRV